MYYIHRQEWPFAGGKVSFPNFMQGNCLQTTISLYVNIGSIGAELKLPRDISFNFRHLYKAEETNGAINRVPQIIVIQTNGLFEHTFICTCWEFTGQMTSWTVLFKTKATQDLTENSLRYFRYFDISNVLIFFFPRKNIYTYIYIVRIIRIIESPIPRRKRQKVKEGCCQFSYQILVHCLEQNEELCWFLMNF